MANVVVLIFSVVNRKFIHLSVVVLYSQDHAVLPLKPFIASAAGTEPAAVKSATVTIGTAAGGPSSYSTEGAPTRSRGAVAVATSSSASGSWVAGPTEGAEMKSRPARSPAAGSSFGGSAKPSCAVPSFFCGCRCRVCSGTRGSRTFGCRQSGC